MKITKKSPPKKRGRKPAPPKRYIQTNQVSYIDRFNDTLNNSQNFTYMDYARNANYIQVIRKHYQQMIRMYGVDLTYFRKFNTFFMQGDDNRSNMVYGQDTTAQYYASGAVRAFLDISTYNWLFNTMGYQVQQNINLYIGIQDFRSRFATLFGKTTTQMFYVPVTGNLRFNQLYGVIDCQQFYATIDGQFDDTTMYACNIHPQVKQRPINSQLYKSIAHKTTTYPITGTLQGYMIQDQQYPLQCSGILSGPLTYHTFQNIQNSPAWQLAPQVGDYFNLRIGQIQQQYQITQVFDRVLQNNGGINPLMGKYIFQIQGTRRSPSHQQFTDSTNVDNPASQEQILNQLHRTVNLPTTEQQQGVLSQAVRQNNNCQDPTANIIGNHIAKGIYNQINDQDDYVYGGYGNKLP